MTWIYAALVLAVVVFVATGFVGDKREYRDGAGNIRKTSSYSWRMNKKMFLALLPLLLIIGGCITSIPAGHTGVIVTFGRVEGKVLTEGIHGILPYQEVVLFDNRVQKRSFELEAFSSDIQQTNVTGSVNFTVTKSESQNLYQKVGVNYYDTVIYPRLLEDIKLVFSRYTAEGLIGNRTVLSDESCELIKKDLAAYAIEVVSVNIENIDFTDTFTDAVEAKQVAQQNKLTTETQQEAEIVVAKAEAERKVIAAQAEAERAKIAADAEAYAVKVKAEAEAEANRKLAESLTPDLIKYQEIMQWNGKLPEVVGGEDIFPIYGVGGNSSSGSQNAGGQSGQSQPENQPE